jgi:hypothetical protein
MGQPEPIGCGHQGIRAVGELWVSQHLEVWGVVVGVSQISRRSERLLVQ